MLTDKLYIEYRVYFPMDANQDIIHEMAAAVKDKLYDIFSTENEAEISCEDVTYEVIRECEREE